MPAILHTLLSLSSVLICFQLKTFPRFYYICIHVRAITVVIMKQIRIESSSYDQNHFLNVDIVIFRIKSKLYG